MRNDKNDKYQNLLLELIQENFDGYGIDLPYYINEFFDSLEEIRDKLERAVYDVEFMYYGDAIKYLTKNDATLRESVKLAANLDYSTSDLNSQLLATIHQQNELIQKVYELIDHIEDEYNELLEAYEANEAND